MTFSRAATMSSPAWIALSIAAISRTLVEGTWLKMLRYQCTMQRCQAASGKNSAAPQAGVRDDQPDTAQTALLEMTKERAPARLILLGSLADAENLPITLAVHGDRHQKRHVAYLASPA